MSSDTLVGEGSASLMSSFSPIGMRVLVVDDSSACLTLIERLLELCDYIVTKCECAVEALATLRANTKAFDIVITDIRMPDMDGFELLRQINMEMDVPVILMSGYDTTEEVMKGISYGACHYMSKPPVLRQVRYIWQHVLLRKNTSSLTRSPAVSLSLASKSAKKKKREGSNRPRMQWSAELHKKFVDVVDQLGDEAVPKKILELMHVEGLTRDNVSSHLQRYRRFLASRSMCITDLLDDNDL